MLVSMSIKQKQYSKFKLIIILAVVALVGLAGAGTFFVFSNDSEASAGSVSTAEKSHQSGKSLFSFTGAEGWWQGATNETSMALFEKEKGCFTSVQYKTGIVDIATELEKEQDIQLSGDYTVTPSGTQTLTMQTSSGLQKYELHQFAVTTPNGALKVKGAQEFGYIQLSDGYIKIMGYCDTPDELPSTVKALQAVRHEAST